jgi:predicted aldo/keto reductase-like oxidoreductase
MKKVDRRSFLRLGAVSGLATGLTLNTGAVSADMVAAASDKRTEGVRKYVRLGRTELKVADISLGTASLRTGDEHLVHHAMDLGVNYLDTAAGYGKGISETVIGKALKDGRRDQVYIATKTFAGPNASADEIMADLDASLARLQTDHVEVFFNWALNDINRLKNEEWLKFADRAKQQGKVRFFGMSGHAGNLIECAEYAVEQDMFDVLLLATNFGEDPAFYEKFTKSMDFVANQQGLQKVMAKAKEKDMGIVAMKVLMGAKLNDMRPYEKDGYTYSQAAFRWILNHPHVDNLIVTMRNSDQIDEYLGASGSGQVTQYDMELLQQYAGMNNASYCRRVCNDCEGSCPYNVPIADVLRTRMYATDYEDFAFAREEYARLDHNASPCLSCDGAPCRDACSYEVPIADLCGPTHSMLS